MCLLRLLIFNGQLYLSGVGLGVNLRMDIERHVLKRDWTMCSRFVNFFVMQ